MTTLARTQARSAIDGRLTARCLVCGVHLEQLDDTGVVAALDALDRAHPSAEDRRHPRGVPAGWRARLQCPGALGQ